VAVLIELASPAVSADGVDAVSSTFGVVIRRTTATRASITMPLRSVSSRSTLISTVAPGLH
jgi:hypothetical protein